LIGNVPSEGLSVPVLDRYAMARQAEIKARGWTGSRTVDREIQTLSNAFAYAKRAGVVVSNPLRDDRPRYYRPSQARHARDCAPASGKELHAIARTLADDPHGEVLAWQYIFAAMTGCRTSEILRLRIDAAPRMPGCLEGDWLWIARSKSGVNPFVVLHPDLREAIKAHRAWLHARHPSVPWWFPSPRVKGQAVDSHALAHALRRVTEAMGIPARTAHGARAYYVTLRRSQGIGDPQIAAEIGDKSVALISNTYGQVPPGWRGGPELSWLPSDGSGPWWSVLEGDELKKPLIPPLIPPKPEIVDFARSRVCPQVA
jgi:integrase